MESLKKIDEEIQALLKEKDQTNARIKKADADSNSLKKHIQKLKDESEDES